MSIDWTVVYVIAAFSAVDLVFRFLIHRDIDSMAADIIIFANVTAWYSELTRAFADPDHRLAALAAIRLLALIIILCLFAGFHGWHLIRKCREKLESDFSDLIRSIADIEGLAEEARNRIAAILQSLQKHAVAEWPVNIAKGFPLPWLAGNTHKEDSRKNLIEVVREICPTCLTGRDESELFLLSYWPRWRYCLACFFFGLSAVVVSALAEFGPLH